jgi:hypothetical protein
MPAVVCRVSVHYVGVVEKNFIFTNQEIHNSAPVAGPIWRLMELPPRVVVMSMDFAHILEPSEIANPPVSLKKFLFRERQPSGIEQTRSFYAFSYAQGFERLAEAALQNWPGAAVVQMPLFFLARHSIELHLKDAIESYGRYSTVAPELSGHHLARLWNHLQKQIEHGGFPNDDNWTRYCNKVIHHIHEIDPDGERFRYPLNVKGVEFEFTRVELEGLKNAHWHITRYCDAAASMIADCDPGW